MNKLRKISPPFFPLYHSLAVVRSVLRIPIFTDLLRTPYKINLKTIGNGI